ncbi:MAG: acetyl-CoA carboxylase biotin carboxyl carrier protein [Acidobacteriota bacterium]
MQIKEIAELIQLLERSAIEEFELERSGVRIRVKKGGGGTTGAQTSNVGVSEGSSLQPRELAPPVQPAEPEKEDDLIDTFKAPIVGTFYLTPKPDAEAFVKVGDQVAPGTVLCIIEAMKIFNQIESDVEGEIVKVLVENGQPVEYGEALFEIRVNA